MLNIKSILHPTDFSDSAQAALVHAVSLARLHGARLDVLHVGPTFGADPLRGAYEVAIDEEAFYKKKWGQADADMQRMLDGQDIEGLLVRRTHSRGAAPAPVILAFAKAEAIDLIVLGTHGRRGLRRLLMGSVAKEVVQHAPCPVLVVGMGQEEAPKEGALSRIIVPIDFSSPSRTVLSLAKHFAAGIKGKIVLLHVVSPLQYPDFYNTSLLKTEYVEDQLEAKAVATLADWYAAAPGPDVAYDVLAVTGYIPRTILNTAEEQRASYIVMASHGLTGIEKVLVGSIAEKVLAGAACPVLVVKTFGKSLLPTQERTAEPATDPG